MSEQSLPVMIGQTENVLRALLSQTLAGGRIAGYDEWVLLNMLANGAPEPVVVAALGSDANRVEAARRALTDRGLLTDGDVISARGKQELTTARNHVSEVTKQLTAGIDPEQERVCREVLAVIRANAEQVLTASEPLGSD